MLYATALPRYPLHPTIIPPQPHDRELVNAVRHGLTAAHAEDLLRDVKMLTDLVSTYTLADAKAAAAPATPATPASASAAAPPAAAAASPSPPVQGPKVVVSQRLDRSGKIVSVVASPEEMAEQAVARAEREAKARVASAAYKKLAKGQAR